MKSLLLAGLLLVPVLPGFGQKLALTGGYTRVGHVSFPGAATLGLHGSWAMGRHLAAGFTLGAARDRHAYELYIWSFGGGRTVHILHNSLYTAHGWLGFRQTIGPRLVVVAGPSIGLSRVGRREELASGKLSAGLWTNVTYQRLFRSRFNLEAIVHPRWLAPGPQVEDASPTFADRSLAVWDVQLGLSWNLRKQP